MSLERQALDSAACDAFVKNLIFPTEQYSREVLLRLAECDFEMVSNPVRVQVRELAEAFNSSLLNERMIKRIRDGVRLVRSHSYGPRRVWQSEMTDPQLAAHDRPPAAVTMTAKKMASDAGRTVPSTLFESKEYENGSMTVEELNGIHAKSPIWPTVSPESWRTAGVRFKAALWCSYSWARLENSYLSLLLSPGVLYRRPGSALARLVVATFPYGFISWRVRPTRDVTEDLIELAFHKPASDTYRVEVLEDPDEGDVLDIELLPPNNPKFSKPGSRLRLITTGKQSSPLQHSASRGFKGLQVPHLKNCGGAWESSMLAGNRHRRVAS